MIKMAIPYLERKSGNLSQNLKLKELESSELNMNKQMDQPTKKPGTNTGKGW